MSVPATGSEIKVQMQLSSQWNGAFEGQLVLTTQINQPLTTWTTSFISRYELRGGLISASSNSVKRIGPGW